MAIQNIDGKEYYIQFDYRGINLPEEENQIPKQYLGKEISVKYGARKDCGTVMIIESENLPKFVWKQGEKISDEMKNFAKYVFCLAPRGNI